MVAGDALLLFMSSSMYWHNWNYCTLLQAVTKRRCHQLQVGKRERHLGTARTLAGLCGYNSERFQPCGLVVIVARRALTVIFHALSGN